jgi:hypothetical protein
MLIAALTGGGFKAPFEGDAIERRALTGEEMVDLLYERQNREAGLVIDLFNDHVVAFSRRREPLSLPPDANAIAIALQEEREARLYVFGHGAYSLATQVLMTRGVEWRELSVPFALRDERRTGWSRAFLDLVARATTREAFKNGLARLLAGGGRIGGSVAEGEALSLPRSPGARITKIALSLTVVASMIGCALVALWAERRRG